MYCIKELKKQLPSVIDDKYKLRLLDYGDIDWYIDFFLTDYFKKYQDDRISEDDRVSIKVGLTNTVAAYRVGLKQSGAMRLVLEDLDTENCVGGCTIYERENNSLELGYWILPAYSGKGLAKKLVKQATGIVKELDNFSEVYVEIRCDNIASICVAEECGYKLLREIDGKYTKNLIYNIRW